MFVITGANGFIGSCLVEKLNNEGIDNIVCVDSVGIKERSNNLLRLKYKKFLLKEEIWSFLYNAEIAKDINWIIHMGACSSTTENNWDFLKENNVEYSQKLYNFCCEYQIPFIYASSAATYGLGEHGFKEDIESNILSPLNLYGKSKLEFDKWVLKKQESNCTKPPYWYGFRFFNVYGPNEYHKKDMASVVYKAYKQIKLNGYLKLFKSYNPKYKDGEQLRDFIYVKDVNDWIYDFMIKKPESGIYNMGYQKARTWLALAEAVFKNLQKPSNIQWIEMPSNIKNQYQYFTEANINKLINQGLSSPKWSLEDGVEDYIKNYLL